MAGVHSGLAERLNLLARKLAGPKRYRSGGARPQPVENRFKRDGLSSLDLRLAARERVTQLGWGEQAPVRIHRGNLSRLAPGRQLQSGLSTWGAIKPAGSTNGSKSAAMSARRAADPALSSATSKSRSLVSSSRIAPASNSVAGRRSPASQEARTPLLPCGTSASGYWEISSSGRSPRTGFWLIESGKTIFSIARPYRNRAPSSKYTSEDESDFSILRRRVRKIFRSNSSLQQPQWRPYRTHNSSSGQHDWINSTISLTVSAQRNGV